MLDLPFKNNWYQRLTRFLKNKYLQRSKMVIDIWCCLSDISIILVSDSHIDLARVWIPDLHNKEIIIRGLLEKYWYLPRRIKQFFCKKYSSVLEGLNILNNHTRMCVRNYLRKKKAKADNLSGTPPRWISCTGDKATPTIHSYPS